MRVRVAYTYYSEYCGGDPCEHEDEVPEGADLAAWLDENYPRDDYGEEGPFNHWSPSVYDEAGNLLYERDDDFTKLEAHKGKEEYTLYAIAILKKGEQFSWETLEQRFCKVIFHADDDKGAADAVADAMEEMMKAGDEVEAPWFPMKLFRGDEECTHDLSNVLFDREIIKWVPVKQDK